MPIKERHWNNLVTSLRYGRSVLVLGPEIPYRLTVENPPLASEQIYVTPSAALASHLTAELAADGKSVTGSTLPVVAQNYEDAEGFGQAALRSVAAQFLVSSRFFASHTHEALAGLPFQFIVTTCQDATFTVALREVGKAPVIGRYHFRGDRLDNPELRAPESAKAPVVYHLFGNADEPQSLVLSENDLLDFLTAAVAERPPLPNSFKRALQRAGQNFLFVGFGVNNWYLRVLLKVIVRSLELNRNGSTLALERLEGLSDTERQQTILFLPTWNTSGVL